MDKNIVLVIKRLVYRYRYKNCNQEYSRDFELCLFHHGYSLLNKESDDYYNYRNVGTTWVWYNRIIWNPKKIEACATLPNNY